MFGCVHSLWCAARNRGVRAQIPNERVFSQCVWLGPESKQRKTHKQSCPSEIFIPNLLAKKARCLPKKKKLSSCLKQILIATSVHPDCEIYTSIHPSQDHVSMCVLFQSCLNEQVILLQIHLNQRDTFCHFHFSSPGGHIPLRLRIQTRQTMLQKN